jgi:hypothetical protein
MISKIPFAKMKTFIILLISAFFLNCCQEKAHSPLYYKEVLNEEFVFTISYQKNDSNNIAKLKNLEIKDFMTKETIQVIGLELIELPEQDISINISKDVNFDGFNDLIITNYVGSYNSNFSFWLFSKQRNQFIHYKALDEMNNPIILEKENEICSKYRIGLSEFFIEKYFWKNDILILKEKHEEFWTENGILKTTTPTNNGYKTKDSIIFERVIENMNCE